MKLSIVIPVYNEARTIESVIPKVEQAPLPAGWEKEIILVNDASTDATATLLAKYSDKHTVLNLEKNSGKGGAVKAGLKKVTGDYIVFQDADLEYNPAEYTRLLQPIIDAKANVVFGSRTLFDNNVPFGRIYFYGGLMVTRIFNLLFWKRFTDIATCYKVFPKKYLAAATALQSNDFVYDVIELTYLLASHEEIIEVPITYKARDRSSGKKLNWRHGLRCLLMMLKIFFKHGRYLPADTHNPA